MNFGIVIVLLSTSSSTSRGQVKKTFCDFFSLTLDSTLISGSDWREVRPRQPLQTRWSHSQVVTDSPTPHESRKTPGTRSDVSNDV